MARVPLSQLHEFEVADRDQDIRGWPVVNDEGNPLGIISELIVDTDSEMVESVMLDTGARYPARDIQLGQGIVRLKGGGFFGAGGTAVAPVTGAHIRFQRK